MNRSLLFTAILRTFAFLASSTCLIWLARSKCSPSTIQFGLNLWFVGPYVKLGIDRRYKNLFVGAGGCLESLAIRRQVLQGGALFPTNSRGFWPITAIPSFVKTSPGGPLGYLNVRRVDSLLNSAKGLLHDCGDDALVLFGPRLTRTTIVATMIAQSVITALGESLYPSSNSFFGAGNSSRDLGYCSSRLPLSDDTTSYLGAQVLRHRFAPNVRSIFWKVTGEQQEKGRTKMKSARDKWRVS